MQCLLSLAIWTAQLSTSLVSHWHLEKFQCRAVGFQSSNDVVTVSQENLRVIDVAELREASGADHPAAPQLSSETCHSQESPFLR